MTTLFDVVMALAFVAIFCVVHFIFKNIKDIFLWTCKLLTTTVIWSILWIATHMHQLPTWKLDLMDSVFRLVNLTKGEL